MTTLPRRRRRPLRRTGRHGTAGVRPWSPSPWRGRPAAAGRRSPRDLQIWRLAGMRPPTARPGGSRADAHGEDQARRSPGRWRPWSGLPEAATDDGRRRPQGLHVTPGWLADDLAGRPSPGRRSQECGGPARPCATPPAGAAPSCWLPPAACTASARSPAASCATCCGAPTSTRSAWPRPRRSWRCGPARRPARATGGGRSARRRRGGLAGVTGGRVRRRGRQPAVPEPARAGHRPDRRRPPGAAGPLRRRRAGLHRHGVAVPAAGVRPRPARAAGSSSSSRSPSSPPATRRRCGTRWTGPTCRTCGSTASAPFAAAVRVCAPVLATGRRRRPAGRAPDPGRGWGRLGAGCGPAAGRPRHRRAATLGGRAAILAGFRDQYYGLAGAVRERDELPEGSLLAPS